MHGFRDEIAILATVVLRLLFEISKLYYWRQSNVILFWWAISIIGAFLTTSGVLILVKALSSCTVGYYYYTRVLDHRDKNTFIGLGALVLTYIIWAFL